MDYVQIMLYLFTHCLIFEQNNTNTNMTMLFTLNLFFLYKYKYEHGNDFSFEPVCIQWQMQDIDDVNDFLSRSVFAMLWTPSRRHFPPKLK